MRFLLPGLLLVAAAAFGVACGTAQPPTAMPTATPLVRTATPVPNTPTPVPTTLATNTPVLTPTAPPVATPIVAAATPTQPSGSADPISLGKQVFEQTAGGVGCAYCHGLDARGKAELASPDIRGAGEDMIWNALETRVQMSFITLKADEVSAVAAYLGQFTSEPTR